MDLKDYDIIKVIPIGGFILEFVFKNGHRGQINFSRYFGQNPVYDRLRTDKELFNSFKIESGILTWANGEIDIAPETIYHDSTNEPYPDWLDANEL